MDICGSQYTEMASVQIKQEPDDGDYEKAINGNFNASVVDCAEPAGYSYTPTDKGVQYGYNLGPYQLMDNDFDVVEKHAEQESDSTVKMYPKKDMPADIAIEKPPVDQNNVVPTMVVVNMAYRPVESSNQEKSDISAVTVKDEPVLKKSKLKEMPDAAGFSGLTLKSACPSKPKIAKDTGRTQKPASEGYASSFSNVNSLFRSNAEKTIFVKSIIESVSIGKDKPSIVRLKPVAHDENQDLELSTSEQKGDPVENFLMRIGCALSTEKVVNRRTSVSAHVRRKQLMQRVLGDENMGKRKISTLKNLETLFAARGKSSKSSAKFFAHTGQSPEPEASSRTSAIQSSPFGKGIKLTFTRPSNKWDQAPISVNSSYLKSPADKDTKLSQDITTSSQRQGSSDQEISLGTNTSEKFQMESHSSVCDHEHSVSSPWQSNVQVQTGRNQNTESRCIQIPPDGSSPVSKVPGTNSHDEGNHQSVPTDMWKRVDESIRQHVTGCIQIPKNLTVTVKRKNAVKEPRGKTKLIPRPEDENMSDPKVGGKNKKGPDLDSTYTENDLSGATFNSVSCDSGIELSSKSTNTDYCHHLIYGELTPPSVIQRSRTGKANTEVTSASTSTLTDLLVNRSILRTSKACEVFVRNTLEKPENGTSRASAVKSSVELPRKSLANCKICRQLKGIGRCVQTQAETIVDAKLGQECVTLEKLSLIETYLWFGPEFFTSASERRNVKILVYDDVNSDCELNRKCIEVCDRFLNEQFEDRGKRKTFAEDSKFMLGYEMRLNALKFDLSLQAKTDSDSNRNEISQNSNSTKERNSKKRKRSRAKPGRKGTPDVQENRELKSQSMPDSCVYNNMCLKSLTDNGTIVRHMLKYGIKHVKGEFSLIDSEVEEILTSSKLLQFWLTSGYSRCCLLELDLCITFVNFLEVCQQKVGLVSITSLLKMAQFLYEKRNQPDSFKTWLILLLRRCLYSLNKDGEMCKVALENDLDCAALTRLELQMIAFEAEASGMKATCKKYEIQPCQVRSVIEGLKKMQQLKDLCNKDICEEEAEMGVQEFENQAEEVHEGGEELKEVFVLSVQEDGNYRWSFQPVNMKDIIEEPAPSDDDSRAISEEEVEDPVCGEERKGTPMNGFVCDDELTSYLFSKK